VREAGTDALSRDSTTRFCADAAGRASLALWPGDWYVFVPGGAGYGFARLTATAGESAHEIPFTPYALCTGVLTGGDDAPVAGARVQVRGQASADRDADRDALLSFTRAHLQRLVREVATDESGAFAIPFLPLEGHGARAQLVAASRRTEEFELTATATPLQMRLQ
jgi:hypothetical protein